MEDALGWNMDFCTLRLNLFSLRYHGWNSFNCAAATLRLVLTYPWRTASRGR